MQIENLPPNKPNFGLVLAIAGAGLIVFFVMAYLFLHKERVMPGRYTKHPVSNLVVPGGSPSNSFVAPRERARVA